MKGKPKDAPFWILTKDPLGVESGFADDPYKRHAYIPLHMVNERGEATGACIWDEIPKRGDVLQLTEDGRKVSRKVKHVAVVVTCEEP